MTLKHFYSADNSGVLVGVFVDVLTDMSTGNALSASH
jgi:hypothetical protein